MTGVHISAILQSALMLSGTPCRAKDLEGQILHTTRTGRVRDVPFRIASVKGGKHWVIVVGNNQPVLFDREAIEAAMIAAAQDISSRGGKHGKQAGSVPGGGSGEAG